MQKVFLKHPVSGILKRTLLCVLILLSCFFVDVKAAFAHRPHDVIDRIELSPNYAQDKTVLSFVRGNLFKSKDGGESWQRIVKGLDNKANLASLSISAQTANKVYLSSLSDGVYRSDDGGDTWVKVNRGLTNSKIDLLSTSPHSPDLVLAAVEDGGLYKTENGGQQWESILNSNSKISAIAYFPDSKDRIIVGDRQGTLYVSEDRGKVWKKGATIQGSGKITTIALSPNFATDKTFWVGTEKKGIFQTRDRGVTFTAANQGVSGGAIQDIAISPNYAKDLTVFTATWDEAVFQSNDGGKTWKQYKEGITKDSQADVPKFSEPHFYELGISQNFATDKTIFLGSFNGLFKSTDGGRVWQELGTLSIGTIIGLAVSPNYQNDSTLAIATYVGNIYISQDKGATWKNITNGLEIPRFTNNFKKPHQDPRRFFDITFSPNYASDKTLFGSVLWTDVLKTTNSGQFWNIISLSKEVRGVTIAVSPNFATDKTVYATNQPGIIFKSTDGGNRFSEVGKIGKVKGNDPPSLVISPDFATDKTLYGSGPEGVYKSVDAGQTWKSMTTGTALMESSNIQLAISPNYKTDRTILAGTSQGLFKTKDAGESWEKLASVADLKDAYLQGVAISPNYSSDRTFIASVKGKGLFKTTDGGETFTKIGNDSVAFAKMVGPPSAPVPIKFSPSYATDKTIYGFGGSTTEVFKSTDGGETWETITITPVDNNQHDLLTQLQLFGFVYRGRILRVLIALILAVFGYFIAGKLHLEKTIPLNKQLIKAGCASIVFLASLAILYFV
jgi:photosystem II stability/assembly factor-like uncharacterized protein